MPFVDNKTIEKWIKLIRAPYGVLSRRSRLGIKKAKSKTKKTRSKRKTLWERDSRCHYCGVELTLDSATLDHKIPRSKGGSNALENLVLACSHCNSLKGDLIIPDNVNLHRYLESLNV